MKTEMPINYDIEYPVLLRKYHELCNEFCGQRDAALKLADDWEKWELYCIEIENPNIGLVPSQAANELRAIFEPKEGK